MLEPKEDEEDVSYGVVDGKIYVFDVVHFLLEHPRSMIARLMFGPE